MNGVVPSHAVPVPNPPFTYYIWPELQDDVTPIVRIHVFYGGDIDDPCVCMEDIEDKPLPKSLERYDAETVVELIYEVLGNAREKAVSMVMARGWSISGRPETVITCTHDYDPRLPQTP